MQVFFQQCFDCSLKTVFIAAAEQLKSYYKDWFTVEKLLVVLFLYNTCCHVCLVPLENTACVTATQCPLMNSLRNNRVNGTNGKNKQLMLKVAINTYTSHICTDFIQSVRVLRKKFHSFYLKTCRELLKCILTEKKILTKKKHWFILSVQPQLTLQLSILLL